MPYANRLDELQTLLSRVHALQTEWNQCIADLDRMVDQLVEGHDLARTNHPSSVLVLHETFAVRWGGHACRLGPTTPFRLMERLARRPNQYVTYEQLINDVWDGQARSESAIRSAVRELRKSLRDAEMHPVADALHGQGRCYGLMLNHLRKA